MGWRIAFSCLLPVVCIPVAAAEIDLTSAVIVAPDGLNGPERQAVRMLAEETARRSWVQWNVVDKLPSAGGPAIVVGPANLVRPMVPSLAAGDVGKEGYRIGSAGATVFIAGDDSRGVLFGVGRLLRELQIERERVTLPADFTAASAPKTPLRGHQIGYRPKTNSYDGWTVAMWEQYVRDLIVFGCNAIEIIPPRSDDDDDSPLFPEPPLRTMIAVSRIADSYGLDVWVWYPALDANYDDPGTVAAAIDEWGKVFAALPRIDAVFVPGGDPGHTPPKTLFPFLEKQTANLRKHHPHATMWVSPQGFNGAWIKDFYALMRQEPAWLTGVVHGPQIRVSLPELRANLPKRYPIRDYPDITHSRSCQYPVPDWEMAFAHTIGREGCNPRALQMGRIYEYSRPSTAGFITYSEGCHDDVNKVAWSALGWDEKADLRETLRQYGRYFIGAKLGDRFADGLIRLERNWVGPARRNGNIGRTLATFQALERDAGPREKLNWRFQQALYRAYYDAYVQTRLAHELAATDAARAKLREAKTIGSERALVESLAILDAAAKQSPGIELRARSAELAEALFQSVRAQLSVPKYDAIAVGRGANFDSIDAPLSDAAWLRSQIAAVRKQSEEPARLATLKAIVDREDPGPGGFYDDLGDPQQQPHLVCKLSWYEDPAYYASPQSSFGRGIVPLSSPRTWWNYAEAHFDSPLQMQYSGLDAAAKYRVRVVYAQAEGEAVRLTAGIDLEVHDFLIKQLEPLEFPIPPAAYANGELTLTWTQELGRGGNGRGCQVCEVWVIREAARAQ